VLVAKPKVMRESLLIAAIIIFVFLALIYHFKIKIAFHANILDGLGFISIKFFLFRLFSAKFVLTEEGKFEMDEPKKKPKKKKKAPLLLMVYFGTLAKRLDIKKFEIYLTCGSNENAEFVSIMSGTLLSVASIVSGILLEKYKHLKIFTDIDPLYDKDALEISSSIVVSFCLLDMLIAVVYAYFEYFKVLRERKNAR